MKIDLKEVLKNVDSAFLSLCFRNHILYARKSLYITPESNLVKI